MSKSIIFVVNSMNVGGVEKALLGVLNQYLNDNWEVHLALLRPSGGFMEYIPGAVQIHHVNGFAHAQTILHTPLHRKIVQFAREGKLLTAAKLSYAFVAEKLFNNSKPLYREVFNDIPVLCDKVFDVAVAFAGPFAFIDYYVLHRIRAKERWGWIHFDISKFYYNRSIATAVYSHYSRINVVSEQGCEIVRGEFPDLADKIHHVPNIIEEAMIRKLAAEAQPLAKHDGRKTILTVGRLSAEKGQYLALQALKLLIEQGHKDLCWWFVGTGADEQRCKQYVAENNLTEYVRFFGSQANPYPWMAACDIYVQPSVYEGYCITLAEARIFGMPIVTTDFTGAMEQLCEYIFGSRICKFDSASIAHAVTSLL